MQVAIRYHSADEQGLIQAVLVSTVRGQTLAGYVTQREKDGLWCGRSALFEVPARPYRWLPTRREATRWLLCNGIFAKKTDELPPVSPPVANQQTAPVVSSEFPTQETAE